jgi:hypothetical protein
MRCKGKMEDRLPGEKSELDPTEWCESHIAFDCGVCTCTEKKRAKYGDCNYIVPSDDSLAHRKCCHNVPPHGSNSDWLSPLDEMYQKDSHDMERSNALEWVTWNEIRGSLTTAKRQEAALYNADFNPRKQFF